MKIALSVAQQFMDNVDKGLKYMTQNGVSAESLSRNIKDQKEKQLIEKWYKNKNLKKMKAQLIKKGKHFYVKLGPNTITFTYKSLFKNRIKINGEHVRIPIYRRLDQWLDSVDSVAKAYADKKKKVSFIEFFVSSAHAYELGYSQLVGGILSIGITLGWFDDNTSTLAALVQKKAIEHLNECQRQEQENDISQVSLEFLKFTNMMGVDGSMPMGEAYDMAIDILKDKEVGDKEDHKGPSSIANLLTDKMGEASLYDGFRGCARLGLAAGNKEGIETDNYASPIARISGIDGTFKGRVNDVDNAYRRYAQRTCQVFDELEKCMAKNFATENRSAQWEKSRKPSKLDPIYEAGKESRFGKYNAKAWSQ